MTQIDVTKISHHKHCWVALACQQDCWPNSTEPPTALLHLPRPGRARWGLRSDAASQSFSTTILQGLERGRMYAQLARSPSDSMTLTFTSPLFLVLSLIFSTFVSPPSPLAGYSSSSVYVQICGLPLLTSSQALSSPFFFLHRAFLLKLLAAGECWGL